jgi:uncharacterized alpha-E superfamily protein
MLARDAESLFWIGRYMERAEDTARLLDVTYHGLLETTAAEERAAWSGALAAVGLDEAFAEAGRSLAPAAVSDFLVTDRTNQGSIVSAVEQARENARTVRGWLSTELWEAVNSFHLQLRSRNLPADLEHQPYDLYGFVRRQCQAVAGVAHETLPRDEGWRFLELGWNLERAEWSSRLLRVRQSQLGASGFHEWVGTLRSAAGLEAYRRTHRGSMDPADVVEFLLLSRTFPRSVLHAVSTAEQSLQLLGLGDEQLSRPLRLLGRLRADLEFADVRELMAGDLADQLAEFEHAVRQVGTAVSLQYFTNSHELDMHALKLLPGERWAS